MTYWLGMITVLLVGYALVKWSGRANVQENKGVSSLGYGASLGSVGIRTLTDHTLTDQAGNQGENKGNGRGKA